MRLGESDRRSLMEIERAIRAEDPAFAERMTDRRGGRLRRSAQWILARLVRPWGRWLSSALIPIGLALLVVGSVRPDIAVTAAGGVLVATGSAWASAAWILRGRRPQT